MLACVSPADADLEETLNTLKYANRARQIRNKPLVVQDPLQAQIAALQEHIVTLQARLAHYEGGGSTLPPMELPAVAGALSMAVVPSAPPAVSDSSLLKRLSQLEAENEALRKRLTSMALGGATAGGASAALTMATGGGLGAIGEASISEEALDSDRSKPASAEEEILAQEQV